MVNEHIDVMIVGAGLSGIAAAYHLQTRCPGRSYAILEARDSIGGTWDLFRYPGVRSDSDMHTLGYSFRPWTEGKAIADGESILRYVRETASASGIDAKIRYRHRVKSASWSSREARWTVEVERGERGEVVRFTAGFVFLCAGYYDYERGYTPEFSGAERFQGRIVHPQQWTPDIDYAGKRVVVIGSGATAMTLVPALATAAAHVTMLQRSPTYVVSRPDVDPIADALRRRLPPRAAYALTRWKNVLTGMVYYGLSKKKPERVKALMLSGVRAALGREFDVDKHFTPRYAPWDQRVCLVPNGDLFHAIRSGRASVVTDTIETFTEKGLKLSSGEELAADLIVTATGLSVIVAGGLTLRVDDQPVDLSRCFAYRGMMYSDVPNLASCFGYVNASWTLKCELIAEYVCRLLNHMEKTGARACTPRNHDHTLAPAPYVDFSSGYIQRVLDRFPKQGSKAPWRAYQNYVRDLVAFRYAKLDDGVMEFSNPSAQPSRDLAPAATIGAATAREPSPVRLVDSVADR